MPGHLGRHAPPDFDHVSRYALSALGLATPATVERTLKLPSWHWSHDQGGTGTCTGHGSAMERAITNGMQAGTTFRYDPIWEYEEARRVGGDPNPDDLEAGWTVRGVYDVWRREGGRPVYSMRLDSSGIPRPVREKPKTAAAEVAATRWGTTVDELRAGIAAGLPVTMGVNWYSRFDDPTYLGADRWAARDGDDLGSIRGGHCFAFYGASDRRQGFKIKNSWGRSYPLCWIAYSVVERLLGEDGEAALVTDR